MMQVAETRGKINQNSGMINQNSGRANRNSEMTNRNSGKVNNTKIIDKDSYDPNNRSESDLFDDTAGYDEETGVQIADNLSPEDKLEAATLYRLFNGLWGVILVTGDPGTGKDLFGNMIAYKIKRYFPWKRILRDEKPRPSFGAYAGLFNEEVLATDLARMKQVAAGGGSSTAAKLAAMDRAVENWVTTAGDVMLKNSLLYLTEFWRYCYNRDPMNPMNRTMGGIHKTKRHLDCLILGTGQLATELDKKTCLPWIDWQVRCTHSGVNKTGFTFFVSKVKYDTRQDTLLPTSRVPFRIPLDAGKPRSYIGDGKIAVKKLRYQPETEEERIVLAVLKSGVDNYEKLVEILETQGDMSEGETLATLKELKFRERKRVVDYPCFFGIYNSKSAPQINTSLKGS